MSGQTIRDVLIKIQLETNSSKFKLPDFGAADKAINRIAGNADKATAGLGKMTDAAAKVKFPELEVSLKVLSELKTQIDGARTSWGAFAKELNKFKPPDLQKFEASLERLQKQLDGLNRGFAAAGAAADAAARQQDSFNDSIVDTIVNSEDATEADGNRVGMLTRLTGATRVNDQATLKSLELEQQRTEVLLKLAGGVTTFARGVAFATAANDDEYQQMLRNIAQYQGYFDLLNGGIQVYQGIIAAKRLATQATLAEAAAEGVLGRARATSGLGGGAAKAGGGILGNLLGGAGAGLLGRGLATAGGYGVAAGTVLAPVAAAGIGIYGGAKIGKYLRENYLDEWTGEADWRRERERQESLYTSQGLERRRASGMEAMEGRFAGIQGDADISRSVLRKQYEYGMGYDNYIDGLNKQKTEIEAKLKGSQQSGNALTSGVESARENVERHQQLLKINEEINRAAEERLQAVQTEVMTARELQQLAQKTLQTERARYESAQEQFGRYDKFTQDRIKAISEEYKKNGKLTDSQAAELSATGSLQAQQVLSAHYSQAGKNAGSDVSAQNFNFDAGMKQAMKDMQAMRASAGEAEKDSIEEMEKFLKSLRDGKREEIALIQALLRDYATSRQQVQFILNEIEKRRISEAKGGSGGGGTIYNFYGLF